MKQLTHWIVRQFVKNHEDIENPEVRAKYGSLEGWVSIVINIILFALKLTLGLMVQSVSLIADAVHTIADSLTSVVIIIGFRVSQKPSDEEHPFGHGQMEPIATLVVAVLLFVAGFELLQSSVQSILNPTTKSAPLWVIAVIVGTALMKEILARFAYRLGDMIDSSALRADALHHRTDVVATILVVVALIAARYGYTTVDGVMGVLVSIIIFYSAYEISKEAINPLLGQAPSKEILDKIQKIASSFSGVLGVHDIIYHKYGQMSVISLHIEVSETEPVQKLHALSESVEEAIVKKMGGVVVAHIDPVNDHHPEYQNLKDLIGKVIAAIDGVQSFHELRIVGATTEKSTVIFDVSVKPSLSEDEKSRILRRIRQELNHRYPGIKAVVKAEPSYAYTP
jgi:cation diffusion facilitator family transporter